VARSSIGRDYGQFIKITEIFTADYADDSDTESEEYPRNNFFIRDIRVIRGRPSRITFVSRCDRCVRSLSPGQAANWAQRTVARSSIGKNLTKVTKVTKFLTADYADDSDEELKKALFRIFPYPCHPRNPRSYPQKTRLT